MAEEVDQLLHLLQSSSNVARQQAEAQLEAWSQNPNFLTVMMSRTLQASTLHSRQLAASILSWRLPRAWPTLSESDAARLQAGLLECFISCSELPVLKALGEACNALCQSIALSHNTMWQELLSAIGRCLSGDALHRRAALEVLASLVRSMGARLHNYYPEIGTTLAACVKDVDLNVRIAALSVVGVAASSWCSSPEDLPSWHGAADATLEVAVSSLSSSEKEAPQVLVAALRALGRLAPELKSEALRTASLQLACRVLGCNSSPSVEPCQIQALQLLRALARHEPQVLSTPQGQQAVAAAFAAAKDAAPSVDDLDEVSNTALAARECLRVVARANPSQAVPVVLEAAQAASASPDALDRAAAVHAVAFALSGAREAPAGWAVPLARALSDSAVWVRQAACEGAILLAEELKPSQQVTAGLELLLGTLMELLPREPNLELMEKAAMAAGAILQELSTDEAAAKVPQAAPAIFQAMTKVSHALAGAANGANGANGETPETRETALEGGAALAAVARCLTSLASVTADHFAPWAPEAAKSLVLLFRACRPTAGGKQMVASPVRPAVEAACFDAAGAVIASAWSDQSFQAEKEELAAAARSVLLDNRAPSEARASAHNFYARVALAQFEDFAPSLETVMPPALEALRAQETGHVVKHGRSRAVRTGSHEERLAAIEAIGTYAVACGARFAPQLPSALPALCAQAQHPNPQLRAATANALAQIGRVLGDLAQGIPSSDQQAASRLAEAVAQSLSEILQHPGSSAALRCALQAKEDLDACDGFLSLAAATSLSSAAAGRRSEDVEDSDDDQEDEEEDH